MLMKLFSTNNHENIVGLKKAVLNSFPKDKGLYVPADLVAFENDHLKALLKSSSFNEIALGVSQQIIGDEISNTDLESIIDLAFNFTAPLVYLGDNIYSQELWNGPTLAFKDFGARFMAQLISYFNKDSDTKLSVLVATSGDTGGAVASGFLNVPGVEVIILYPSGKVTPLQEQQITGQGANIYALEVSGSFDDCQRMVKEAFIDDELKGKYQLCSANSINIARLIPQSFYYFDAFRQLGTIDHDVVFAVPSGNFGNITAGLIAKRLGLNIKHFIAATNVNNAVPRYLETEVYEPRATISTLSNAMDVGDPSNFVRLQHFCGSTWNNVKSEVKGFYLTDQQTIRSMQNCYQKYSYVCDPHGAIAYQAAVEYEADDTIRIFLETAHPIKFRESVENILNLKLDEINNIHRSKPKAKNSEVISNSYLELKSWLLSR